jgi:hypothetical protein
MERRDAAHEQLIRGHDALDARDAGCLSGWHEQESLRDRSSGANHIGDAKEMDWTAPTPAADGWAGRGTGLPPRR